MSFADITPVSDRTSQVRDAIVTAAAVNTAADVTDTHLAVITRLNLRFDGITELQSGDFSGLTGLTDLNLYGNELSSLPDGIFEGLTALTTLRLGGNTVDPMPITVSLEKVADGQFKAVAPIGAPFDIVLPISATNGSIADNTTSITIAKGSTESSTLTITRTADTTAAVTPNIGTLPSLPANHYGYSLSKSSALPVEIISEVVTTTSIVPETVVPETSTNTAPVFTDGSTAIRSIAENTATETNIGTAVSATDANSDTLTYSLGGTDASSFSIDSMTGQLKTKLALDYETKRVYSVTITVSDGTLTDTITVIISIIDVSETTIVSTSLPVSQRTRQVRDAIVAAVPNVTDAADVTDTHLAEITELDLRSKGITALQSGDFSGLIGLTSLNLYGNMLSSLPYGIFEGLTSLTALRLGRNLVEPMLLIVSIQQVAIGQFKVVIPEGAPFDISVPVNGSTVTISQGSTASATFTSTINVSMGTLPSLPANHYGYVLAKSAVCNRTSQVAEAIAAAVPNVTDCNNVTEVDLATITSLDLSSKSITSLQSDDFAGLLSLSTVDLSNNQLSSIPAGIFEGLTALTSVDLNGNTTDPISLSISLEKVDTNQIKAVIPTGAPFDITLPITVANGSLSSGITLTIPTGSVESTPQTITRTPNTIGAVTANIGTLQSLPSSHSGYALAKVGVLPLEIFSEINVAPIFTDGTTTTQSIAENTVADTNIGTPISATDANNDTLTYTRTGTDAASFSIISTTGQLKTKAALDYETKTTYSVTITVSDGNLTDTISVTINVTDVDENRAPVLTDGESTTRSIAENTGSGVNIGTAVSATDADDDTLTYTLTGTDAAAFSIDSTSGQLRTKSALDYETKKSYSVSITVSDGSRTDSISVTINVTDVDETPATTTNDTSTPNNAPVFSDGNSTTRSVAENTAANTNIGTAVSATDEDDDTLTYRLSGTDASVFSIDSNSGQLKTSGSLDYETKDSYSVTITVSDGNGGSDSISVTINITDIDESVPNNAPTFDDGDSTTRTVAENTSSGVDIGSTVSATDTDDDTLTYSLSGTDASSFSIDSSSGQLRTSASLDYETKDSYSVTVVVSDGRGGSDSISVTINITDLDETAPNNAPVFATDSTTQSIAENTAADTDIGGTITATDADSDRLTYTLSGTNASDFSIVNSSGQLKTKSALNHESKSSYSVTITASDGKGGSGSISVTISVTDVNEAPVFADGTTTTRAIAENVGADINIGTAVKANDPDDDVKLEYTLDGTNADSFNIESTTGQLKTKVALDFETKPSYSVIVKVSDGTLTDSIAVTINVTDLDETPSNIAPVFDDGESTSRSIAENTPAGRNIGAAVSATDEDSNTLAYLLSGDDASSFSIDDGTGQLKTSAALNYEDEDEYSVKVTVSDGSSTDTIDVIISVTDVNEAPVFANDSTTLSVTENTVTNTNIGSAITATDPDGDDLTYSLEGTDASLFDIVSTTGQLKTKAALDYESDTSYSVTLKASDDNLTDTMSITINVTDVDENRAPTFASESTTLSVAENTGPGVNIGDAVSATDADEDTFTYTLSGTDAASFDINSTNGQLRTKAALDYEDKRSYSVTVTASDSKKSDTIDVTINVTDVNENRAPSFGSASTTRSVAENTTSGTNIGAAISATDADEDTITYTLSGTDAASFNIVSTSGQLQTSAALDYEDKKSYSVTVTATDDSGASNNSASITVTISITDVNENRAPSFAGSSISFRISDIASASVGDSIGLPITASDDDDDTLEYSLGGDDASKFTIDSSSAQLKVTQALIDDTSSSYSIKVIATDPDNATAEISVTITVTRLETQQQQQSNSAPTFDNGTSTTRSIAENTASGQNIGSPVSASDSDSGDTLTYSLEGTDASSFSIVSTSGQLQTSTALDYETKRSYTVTVKVTDDSGASNNSATIAVTISVTDVNENRSPAFDEGSTTTRSIDKGTYPSQDLGDPVSATDADDDTLTYTLSGTDAALFEIDSTNGQLSNKDFLRYEDKTSYSVTVTVSDSKGGTNSITVTITDDKPPVMKVLTFIRQNEPNWVLKLDSGTGVVSAVIPADDRPHRRDSDVASFTRPPGVQFDNSFTVAISFDEEVSGLDQSELTLTNNTAGANVTSWETLMGWTGNNTVTQYSAKVEVTQSGTVTFNVAANAATDGSGNSNAAAESKTVNVTITLTDYAPWDVNEDGSIDATDSELVTAALGQTGEDIEDERTDVNWDGTVDADDVTLVTYHIADVVENRAPSFAGSSISFSISDIASASVGDSIGLPITATDLDEDTLEYSLGGDDASKFTIDSSSGQLKVTQALIDDTSSSYSIKVIATDPSDATAEISVTITVTRLVTQQSNSAPTFDDGASTTRSIAENTASGQNIGSPVSASDDDTGDTLTYTLEGTDASSFSIVSTSGQLQTSAALDYETKSSYEVTVKVTDDSGAGNNSATITVTINVTDVTESENPSVTITVPSGTQGVYDAERRYRTFEVTVTFSEVVTRFERTELVLTGTASVVVSMTTTDNITYTFTIEPNGSGTLTFNVAADSAFDTDNNGNTVADEQSVTIDADEPTVELTLPEEPQGSVFTVTITFSEPVNGFDQTDLEIDNVGADWLENEEGSSITDWTASEDRTTYTAEIASTEGMAVYFKVSGRVATDDAGNGNRGTVGKERVFLTIGPPVLVSFRYSGHRYLKDPTDAFIVFNESVTGFGKDDLTLSDNTAGATITNWEAKEDGRTYVATVTAETSGEVKLTVPANVATDDDENTNANSKELTLEFDLVAPTITMSTIEGAIINPGGRYQLNVWFSESVAGFRPSIVDDPQEILVTGGTANLEYWTSKINGGHWHSTLNDYFKFRISVDDDATEVVISIDAGAAEDAAGNGNVGASLTLTVTNDANNAPALQIPKTTTLLANYPNPFNPETWIPYHLADPSNVQISIYNMQGVIVRRLELGHQPSGYYTSRKRAAYWDGTNNHGERVGSGLYFYQLQAGNKSYLRKMVILK